MADRYIDVFEVSEYGSFFLTEIKRLVGASGLVNVEALAEKVQRAKEKVEEERSKAGVVRKSGAGGVVLEAAEVLRGHLTRFFNFLHSLDPKDLAVDVKKFFEGGVLGGLQHLKPADVKAKAEKVSDGFSLKEYKDAPELALWKKKIWEAKVALEGALESRGENRNEGILMTASLSAAREEFLAVYNGVAKPLVKGLLNDLNRAEEFELYFRDLQVNEDRRSNKPSETTTTEPGKPD